VLDFVMRDDATVRAFANASQLLPTNIAAARQALGDPDWGSVMCRDISRARARRANLLLPGLPSGCTGDSTSRPGDVANAARLALSVTTRCPRSPLPTSIATRSTRPWRNANNPDLADKPVIIGGGKRGVGLRACYISGPLAVRSAMPMFKALRCRPSAVVIRPDMAKYCQVSREVRHAMQALTPLVEPLSIDEAVFWILPAPSAFTA